MSDTVLNTDISAIFSGYSAKLLSRMTGRPSATIDDCRNGRSKWRAEDLMRASLHSAQIRARAIAILEAMD